MPAHAPRSRTGLGRRRRAGFVAPVARVARPEAATATARRAVGGRELPEVAGACRQSRSITQRARGVGAPHPRLSRPGMIVAGRRHGPFIPATPAGLFDPRSSRHHSFVIFLLLLFGAGLSIDASARDEYRQARVPRSRHGTEEGGDGYGQRRWRSEAMAPTSYSLMPRREETVTYGFFTALRPYDVALGLRMHRHHPCSSRSSPLAPDRGVARVQPSRPSQATTSKK